MPESQQHKLLKKKAMDTFLKLGYELVSFDRETVEGYRPDLILENKREVLFVEAVVTSDHDPKEVVDMHRGKPVRFIKYYSIDPWISRTIYRKPRPPPHLQSGGRFSVSKKLMDKLEWHEKDMLLLEEYNGKLVVENISKSIKPIKERLERMAA